MRLESVLKRSFEIYFAAPTKLHIFGAANTANFPASLWARAFKVVINKKAERKKNKQPNKHTQEYLAFKHYSIKSPMYKNFRQRSITLHFSEPFNERII